MPLAPGIEERVNSLTSLHEQVRMDLRRIMSEQSETIQEDIMSALNMIQICALEENEKNRAHLVEAFKGNPFFNLFQTLLSHPSPSCLCPLLKMDVDLALKVTRFDLKEQSQYYQLLDQFSHYPPVIQRVIVDACEVAFSVKKRGSLESWDYLGFCHPILAVILAIHLYEGSTATSALNMLLGPVNSTFNQCVKLANDAGLMCTEADAQRNLSAILELTEPEQKQLILILNQAQEHISQKAFDEMVKQSQSARSTQDKRQAVQALREEEEVSSAHLRLND